MKNQEPIGEWQQVYKDRDAAKEARDIGIARSEFNAKNADAVDAARQALEVRIKTCPEFTSSDVIKDVTEQGIEAKDWRCIGGLFARAKREGRIDVLGLQNSLRRSRHCGDQKVWRSLECPKN